MRISTLSPVGIHTSRATFHMLSGCSIRCINSKSSSVFQLGYTSLPSSLRSSSGQSRRFISLSAFSPHVIIHTAERFLDGVHHYTYLPWWAVITCTTFILRSVVTLPLAVHQNKILAKMELLKPTLQEYQEAIKHNVIVKCRRANVPLDEANKRVMKEAKKVTRQFLSQEGCSPYKVAILPWIQLPMWITISFAIRNMSGIFPGMTPLNPETTASLAVEGTLWFNNLTATDSYYLLPFLLVASNFLNIELNSIKRHTPTRLQRTMTNTFRILTIGMGYISAQMPTAMVLYWSMSSTYGLLQNVLFKYPKVRRILGIPKTPSESKHPYKDLVKIVKGKARDFLTLQTGRKP